MNNTTPNEQMASQMTAFAINVTKEVMHLCGMQVPQTGVQAIINDLFKVNSGDSELRMSVFREYTTVTTAPTSTLGQASYNYRQPISWGILGHKNGHPLDVLKSGLQKYGRRMEPIKMKWCAFKMDEMYQKLPKNRHMFTKVRDPLQKENETKFSRAIGYQTNLVNRLIVMLNEEVLFTEMGRYLLVMKLLDTYVANNAIIYGQEFPLKKAKSGPVYVNTNNKNLELIYEACHLICEGKMLRIASDVNAYFNVGMNQNKDFGVPNDIDTVDCTPIACLLENHVLFKDALVQLYSNLVEKNTNVFYWVFVLYNSEATFVTKNTDKKKKVIYLVWSMLLSMCKSNDKVLKVLEYRFERFKKETSEQKFYLIGAIYCTMYAEKAIWDVARPNKDTVTQLCTDEWMKMDSFVIDMHTQQGRHLKKNEGDFANEGCSLAIEDKEFFQATWRAYYFKLKQDKVMGKDKKRKVEFMLEPERHYTEKKIKIQVETEEELMEKLDFISMDAFTDIRLCTDKTCGGKVMCFFGERDGKQFVLKQGRASMAYNKDYEMIDALKPVFGLEAIGMQRIRSDKVMEKIDASVSSFENNWQLRRAKRGEMIVFTMMELVPGGEKYKNLGQVDKEKHLEEFLKIGIFRGIFKVTDFNNLNALYDSEKEKLVSIDEHGLLGDRKSIISKGFYGRLYLEHPTLMENALRDLEKDKETKKKRLFEVVSQMYDVEIATEIVERYVHIRKLVMECLSCM